MWCEEMRFSSCLAKLLSLGNHFRQVNGQTKMLGLGFEHEFEFFTQNLN